MLKILFDKESVIIPPHIENDSLTLKNASIDSIGEKVIVCNNSYINKDQVLNFLAFLNFYETKDKDLDYYTKLFDFMKVSDYLEYKIPNFVKNLPIFSTLDAKDIEFIKVEKILKDEIAKLKHSQDYNLLKLKLLNITRNNNYEELNKKLKTLFSVESKLANFKNTKLEFEQYLEGVYDKLFSGKVEEVEEELDSKILECSHDLKILRNFKDDKYDKGFELVFVHKFFQGKDNFTAVAKIQEGGILQVMIH
jgi:hypothetical protein